MHFSYHGRLTVHTLLLYYFIILGLFSHSDLSWFNSWKEVTWHCKQMWLKNCYWIHNWWDSLLHCVKFCQWANTKKLFHCALGQCQCNENPRCCSGQTYDHGCWGRVSTSSRVWKFHYYTPSIWSNITVLLPLHFLISRHWLVLLVS